jgi:hypothetical protein
MEGGNRSVVLECRAGEFHGFSLDWGENAGGQNDEKPVHRIK